jgi:hypothetical protein
MGYSSIRTAGLQKSWIATVSDREREEALREILNGVWNLKLGLDVSRPTAYLEHYKQARTFGNIKSSYLRSANRKETIDLLNVIKRYYTEPIRVVKNKLRSSSLAAIAQHDDNITITKAIEIGIRLWLMVEPPNITNDTLTIKDIVAKTFKKPRVPAAAKSIKELSYDFSARSLLRKGGINIVWTKLPLRSLTDERETSTESFPLCVIATQIPGRQLYRKVRTLPSIALEAYE